ncbi:hypothetical protein Pan44_41060 [Caulifigura coniformis]|uniref:Uncharacterized protein n=1 Tax=Caulifigura coniformis TaxID=2527983 RepID=A0A517SIY7_9PLAN|nr:hypothetical protein [Caulifigura coniformis]QDT56056.1 hypothetical protein Pan44_41060 [Caulifigura coniformis]
MSQDDLIRELQERYRQERSSLNERQRRQWAATEAMKLGHGGMTLVSRAIHMSPNTIKRGIEELAAGDAESAPDHRSRIRRPGGGRKPRTRPETPPAPEA